jgi:hypothetical protein
MPANGRIHLERRAISDLSDSEIDRLVSLGKREAEMLDLLIKAARRGDRESVWTIAAAFAETQAEIEKLSGKK